MILKQTTAFEQYCCSFETVVAHKDDSSHQDHVSCISLNDFKMKKSLILKTRSQYKKAVEDDFIW